jgi:hypothetical protein
MGCCPCFGIEMNSTLKMVIRNDTRSDDGEIPVAKTTAISVTYTFASWT